MMGMKPGGLLESVIKTAAAVSAARTCETCGHLIQISENSLGCTAHDKLIMPEFPPYHGNMRCPDWTERSE